jgi:hypothetical protein
MEVTKEAEVIINFHILLLFEKSDDCKANLL